jgi:hypothetical protein
MTEEEKQRYHEWFGTTEPPDPKHPIDWDWVIIMIAITVIAIIGCWPLIVDILT